MNDLIDIAAIEDNRMAEQVRSDCAAGSCRRAAP
jgi:hypothetical protein